MARLFSILLATCLSTQMVWANAKQTYNLGYAAKQRGAYEESIQLSLQAAKEAQVDGDSLTEFASYYVAIFAANRLSKHQDCIDYGNRALEIYEANAQSEWTKRPTHPIFILEIIGLIERAYFTQAKLGMGWKYNRQATDYYRKSFKLPAADGPLDPKAVSRLGDHARNLGWRLIEREATYLHETRQTTAAKALLTQAIEAAASDLNTKTQKRSFYALKLIGKMATIEGFVGYEQAALDYADQEYAYAEKWTRRANLIRIRMNYLMNYADLYGADDAAVQEADSLLAEYTEAKYQYLGPMTRLHTKVVAARMTTEQEVDQLLEAAKKSRAQENAVDEFYASRNSLFARAAANAPNLDEEFHSYLNRSREQGNIRAEPRIYRRYGDWLSQQARYPEALQTYKIALDACLLAEWHPQVPHLYAKLGATHLRNGNEQEAESMWAALLTYSNAHPDIPAYVYLKAWHVRLTALLDLGRREEADQLAKTSLSYGHAHKVPQKHLAGFNQLYLDNFPSVKTNDETAPELNQVILTPASTNMCAIPGRSATSTVFLMNPTAQTATGRLHIHGNGLHRIDPESSSDTLQFTAAISQPAQTVIEQIQLAPADLQKITLHATQPAEASKAQAEQTVTVSWMNQEEETTATSIWHYQWGEASAHPSILEASRVDTNPFVGIPVQHHIDMPTDHSSTPFRIRSDEAIHIEYRSPENGSLLAVDHNGNGIFTDSGDFWLPTDEAANHQASPSISRPQQTGAQYSSIEVWYFPHNTQTSTAPMQLDVQLYQENAWQTQSIDQISFSKQ